MAGGRKKSKDASASVKAYLAVYNVACMVGWAIVYYQVIAHLVGALDGNFGDLEAWKGALAGVFAAVKPLLTYVQMAAILEILHSREILGFVKSDAFTASMQVISRVVVLVVCLASPSSANAWHGGTMVMAWCTVEVPRYAFYLVSLVKDPAEGITATPYPLYWYRYSAFSVLYPVGITSELLCEWAAYSQYGAELSTFTGLAPVGAAIAPFIRPFILFAFAVYVPGAPYLFMHMVSARKSGMKKYAASGSAASVDVKALQTQIEKLTAKIGHLEKENKKLKKQ